MYYLSEKHWMSRNVDSHPVSFLFSRPSLPAEQLDSSKALDGLFITLGKVMIELRACSFTTFTSRRRLDAIRQDVKAARGHVDTLQVIRSYAYIPTGVHIVKEYHEQACQSPSSSRGRGVECTFIHSLIVCYTGGHGGPSEGE